MHAKICLVKGTGTIGITEGCFHCFQPKVPPDCWEKTRIVRVGGPRVGAVYNEWARVPRTNRRSVEPNGNNHRAGRDRLPVAKST